jgi:hypothetical protein
MTLTRIALLVLGILLALLVLALVLFSSGGTVPGKGRGDPVGLFAG